MVVPTTTDRCSCEVCKSTPVEYLKITKMKGKTGLPDTSIEEEAENDRVGQMANDGGQGLVTAACCDVHKELGRIVDPEQTHWNFKQSWFLSFLQTILGLPILGLYLH